MCSGSPRQAGERRRPTISRIRHVRTLRRVEHRLRASGPTMFGQNTSEDAGATRVRHRRRRNDRVVTRRPGRGRERRDDRRRIRLHRFVEKQKFPAAFSYQKLVVEPRHAQRVDALIEHERDRVRRRRDRRRTDQIRTRTQARSPVVRRRRGLSVTESPRVRLPPPVTAPASIATAVYWPRSSVPPVRVERQVDAMVVRRHQRRPERIEEVRERVIADQMHPGRIRQNRRRRLQRLIETHLHIRRVDRRRATNVRMLSRRRRVTTRDRGPGAACPEKRQAQRSHDRCGAKSPQSL